MTKPYEINTVPAAVEWITLRAEGREIRRRHTLPISHIPPFSSDEMLEIALRDVETNRVMSEGLFVYAAILAGFLTPKSNSWGTWNTCSSGLFIRVPPRHPMRFSPSRKNLSADPDSDCPRFSST